MKIKEKIAIHNILLLLKQYEFKVDINFKISGFPLTLTLTSLKTDILMLIWIYMTTKGYNNNIHQEATIKMFIA